MQETSNDVEEGVGNNRLGKTTYLKDALKQEQHQTLNISQSKACLKLPAKPKVLTHNSSTKHINPQIKFKYVKKLDSTIQSNEGSRNSHAKKKDEINTKKININVTTSRNTTNTMNFNTQRPSIGEADSRYYTNNMKSMHTHSKADISMNVQINGQKSCKAALSSIVNGKKTLVNISINEEKQVKKPAKLSETVKGPIKLKDNLKVAKIAVVKEPQKKQKLSETLKDTVKSTTKLLETTREIKTIKKDPSKKTLPTLVTTRTKDSKVLNSTCIHLNKTSSEIRSPDSNNIDIFLKGVTSPKKGGISGEQAHRAYKKDLIDYEQKEIMEYNEVYYAGKLSCKLKTPSKDAINNGWDDKKGFYIVKEHDHLAYRYEVLTLLGNGSFGHVYKCMDYKTNELVAIKILRNKEKFHKQGKVEIDIIKMLNTTSSRESQYIVEMKDSFVFRNHICISFEMLSIDLFELIKSSGFVGFALPLVRAFAKQLLTVLDYMKRLNIIHCDLKPENILLKNPKKSAIKVIDFGTGCFDNTAYYTYIQSRYYRAPEIIIGIPYTSSIDMWSLGTILIELFCGVPIFSGEDECEQISMIMEYKGNPPLKMLLLGNRTRSFFDNDFKLIKPTNSKGITRVVGSKALESFVKTDDKKFLDFIKKCLEWDPEKRIKPIEALNHEWLK